MAENGSLSEGDQPPSQFALQLSSRPYLMLIVVPIATYVLWSLFEDLSSPLRKYPGPLLASKTRIQCLSRGPSVTEDYPWLGAIKHVPDSV